jgi:hypothetical protein
LIQGVDMRFKGIYINNNFLSIFTPKELEQILPYNFEVIVSEKKVTISYDANFSDNGGVISKDTFLKLLEESPAQYREIVEVEM